MSYPYEPYKWWVNNVLPLVYDDSLSYYEVLSKLKYYVDGLVYDVKRLTEIVNTIEGIEDIEQFTEMLNRINAKIGELENLQTENKDDIVSAINSIVDDFGAIELEIAGKYTKPEGGIPESDLNDELKEKINAQFEQYKNYNNLSNKPKINHIEIEGDHEPGYYGLGTYSLPDGGIPESDLADGVKNKLNASSENTEKIDGIAPSVETYTADRKYEVGELVFIGGKLYKVIKTVYEGNPFQIGNNIEGTTINSELEEIISELDKLKIAGGADSFELNSGPINTEDKQVYTLFFNSPYFRAITGEDYLFIVRPTTLDRNSGYNINIYNENGDVVFTFNSGNNRDDYLNERRFTFTPLASGNYYCGIKKDPDGSSYRVNQTITLQYTPSQGTQSILQMVSELIPRVEGVEGDIAGLENAVVGAIKYAEYNGGDTLGNQTFNTLCRVPSTRNITDVPGGLENYGRIVWLLTSGNQTNRLQVLISTANPCRAIAYRLMHNGNWLEWIIIKGRYDLYPTGDSTIRSGDMQSFLRDFDKVLFLAPGDYYIRAIAMPEGTSIVGCGVGITRIICTNINSWCAIKMASHCSIKNVSIIFDNGFTDENKPTASYWTGKHGIGIGSNAVNYAGFTNEVECLVENVEIDGFSGCGIFSACTTNENKGSMFRNLRITHCSCGMYLGNHSEFNIVSQCVFGYCYTGVVLMGGNNITESCEIAMHEIGINLVETDYYCDDGQGHGAANDGHGIISNCKIGHMGWVSNTLGSGTGDDGGYAIIRGRQSSAELVANTYITGPVLADHGGQNLSFNGCHIRENTKLFSVGAIMIMTGCYFEGNIVTTVSENGKIYRRACLTYLGETLNDVT